MKPLHARNLLIVKAYHTGETQEVLAARFDLSRQRVGRILIHYGAQRRSRGRPASLTFRNEREEALYCKLRRILGPQVARRELGIAA